MDAEIDVIEVHASLGRPSTGAAAATPGLARRCSLGCPLSAVASSLTKDDPLIALPRRRAVISPPSPAAAKRDESTYYLSTPAVALSAASVWQQRLVDDLELPAEKRRPRRLMRTIDALANMAIHGSLATNRKKVRRTTARMYVSDVTHI